MDIFGLSLCDWADTCRAPGRSAVISRPVPRPRPGKPFIGRTTRPGHAAPATNVGQFQETPFLAESDRVARDSLWMRKKST